MLNTHIKTILFVLGACVGIWIGEKTEYGTEICIASFVLGVVQTVLHVVGKRRDKSRSEVGDAYLTSAFVSPLPIPLITLLLTFGICVGIVRLQFQDERPLYVCEKTCTFTATVISTPEIKNTYQVFTIEPQSKDGQSDTNKYLSIQVRTPLYPRYHIGETVEVKGVVTAAKNYKKSDDVNSFDYVAYLRVHSIGSEIFFPSIQVIDTEPHTLVAILGRAREDFVTRISTYVSPPSSSIASGMLFGQSQLSQEMIQTFRVSGLTHIIVLSGFNIALVITFILTLLKVFPLFIRVSFAFISVFLFVIMVGGEASVIRATLMATVGLGATLVGREYIARQALIVSFFAIIMYSPLALLHDVSLHLSFLATTGIIYCAGILMSYSERIKVQSLREIIVTTVCAYILTLPYSMYTFGTMSVYALIANILVLPIVSFAMLTSFLVVVTSYISTTIASLFGYMTTIIISYGIAIAKMVEGMPFASFQIHISLAYMIAMYICMFLFFIFVYTKQMKNKSIQEQSPFGETREDKEKIILSSPLSY